MRRLLHGFINLRTIGRSCNWSSNPVLTALGQHPQGPPRAPSGRQSVDSRRIQVIWPTSNHWTSKKRPCRHSQVSSKSKETEMSDRDAVVTVCVTHTEAEAAVRELQRAGIDMSRIVDCWQGHAYGRAPGRPITRRSHSLGVLSSARCTRRPWGSSATGKGG